MRSRSEAELLEMLRRRFLGTGRNGHEIAFLTQVPDGTGARARRTIDAVAMTLWPSRGLSLNGYEVKCSRKDWIAELRAPEKADAHARYVDRFYVVTAEDVVRDEAEVPDAWGWYCAHGTTMRCRKEAPLLEPEPINRTYLAAFLRAAVYQGDATPEEVQAALRVQRERLTSAHKAELTSLRNDLAEVRERIRGFESASGLRIGEWADHDPRKVGAAVNLVLRGEAEVAKYEQRLMGLLATVQRLHEQLDTQVRVLGLGD